MVQEHNLSLGIDPTGGKRGARVFKSELDGVKTKAVDTENSLDRMGKRGGKAMDGAAVKAKAFGFAMGKARLAAIGLGAAVGAAAIAGFRSARGLDAALAEASTLLEGTTAEMSLMRKEATAMAAEFGGGATQQVEAFYQAISAGAGSVEEATTLLHTANLLAKGGVTDITTSVDILTTAVNSYAGTGLTAADASDILFSGVKFGKTTVEELASALGRATPLAAKLGISFDELVGATAALTKGGVSTAESVTGIKGIMAAVLKPTKEAADAAELLGLEFNATAVESKGLVGFLEDVIDKTGGSSEAMAQLFGGMEGLTGVLGLATNSGKTFNEAMAEQAERLGATQEAADKVSGSLSDRLDVALGKIGIAAELLGGILLNIVVPAMELVIWAVEGIVAGVKTLGNDIAAVFSFFSKEVVKTAGHTVDWTDTVDTHIQAEYDLEYALGQVTGENQLAAKTAITAANANLDAARAAYDRVKAEVSLAKAIVARQAMEAGAQRALADTGMNFFSDELMDQTKEDFDGAVAFLTEMEAELGERAAGVRRAFQGIDEVEQLNTGGATIWSPERTETIEETTDAVLELEDAVKSLGTSGPPAVIKVEDEMENLGVISEDTADSIANTIGQGFLDMIKGTKSVSEAFRSMALEIAEELFKVLVIQRMVAAMKGLMGFADGGVLSGGSVLANANGNAFGGGNVIPFASGGVVSSPTFFPMQSGLGLMGEAGPEAIMPLSRGSDGKLGVKSADGGGQQSNALGVDIINVLDPSIVGQYMDTAEGRRKIMNIIGEEQAA